MADESKAQYIFVVGPTGTGKSQLALQLGQSLQQPLINCDSVQVYKAVDIGTAKPTLRERQSHTHYLYDYVDPPYQLTAADYLRDVAELIARHSLTQAIFVGGSGFYVQAIQKGLYHQTETPESIKNEIEDWINKEGFASLFRWLQNADPEYAAKISSNDHYRVRRAVEVIKTTGLKVTEQKAKLQEKSFSVLPAHHPILVGLNAERDRLREGIRRRAENMLRLGFVDEVRKLRERGLAQWSPMQSVGYKEVQHYLDGQVSEGELLETIVTGTMQLIKKQQTWFKKQEGIKWFSPCEITAAREWVLAETQRKM